MSPTEDKQQETINALAASNFTSAAGRIAAAAKMARNARNRVGQYGSPDGKPTLLDERAVAMGVLRLVHDWPESQLVRKLGLHRAMVHAALNTQVADQRKIPSVPDWSEDHCVALLNSGGADTKEAIRVLYFRHGMTKAVIAAQTKTPKAVISDALRPSLLKIHQLPNWSEEEAQRRALALESEIKHQRAIWWTAGDVVKELAKEMMQGVYDGRPYSNAEIVELTGLSSPTVAQIRRGTSNEWKKTRRKLARQVTEPEKVDSAST